jgi:hypothetical protein
MENDKPVCSANKSAVGLLLVTRPSDVMGEDYPSETFRVLKTKECGEYRTQRLVLEAFDAFAEVDRRDRRRVVNG